MGPHLPVDNESPSTNDASGTARSLQWIAVWGGIAIVTLLAIYRLRDFPYRLSWIDAFHGTAAVLSATLPATIKVWLFFGWGVAMLTGFALKLEPDLELGDAILSGVAAFWISAYLLGNLLGPIGLFNTPTVWGLLLPGSVWLWLSPPPIPRHALSSGQKLALLAAALLAVSMIPLQLASPIAPFMDVLSYPSSAQRPITFHRYYPFDNDPYGCWGAYAQTPALELFYTMLALGGHTRYAALAETAFMWPMAALMIFGVYRLGRSLVGDTAGGMAGLFLFFTCLFRRAQGMRGTAVDFAMVGLALAFFFEPGRRRILFILGAGLLGTSVAAHAIDGGYAMIVASSALLFWIVEGDFARVEAGFVALAGATLIALPEFAIGLVKKLPYPILPLCLVIGLGLILFASRRLKVKQPATDRKSLAPFNVVLIALFIFAVLFRQSVERFSLYAQIAGNLPMLALFAFGGLVAIVATIGVEGIAAIQYAGAIAVALLLGIVGEYLEPILQAFTHNPSIGMMVSDIKIKLWDYWCPYFLTLPAGYLFALAYDRWSSPLTLFAAMTLLIFPWYQISNPVDYDSVQHSITEQWAMNLNTAAIGYWAGHEDRRWTFSPAEMKLIDTLHQEVAANRITSKTHILHLCNDISSWSLVQFPVLTGINDDPIELHHDPNNLWEGGSRVRGMNELPQAMSRRPPYVLTQIGAVPGYPDPPLGYEKILDEGYLKLYRLSDIESGPPVSGSIFRWLIAFLAILATAAVVHRGRE